MSTLKAANIQNPSSSLVNMTTDTSGGVAFPQLSGLMKANGSSSATAAVAGTDYVAVGGAGTKTLLNTLTAASSSSLADTTSITATYNYYSLMFDAILPSTASQAAIQVRVGGAYQSTSYSGNCHAMVGTAVTNSAYSTQINLTTGTVYNSAEGMHGELIFVNPSATSGNRVIYGCLRAQQDASTNVTTFPRGYYTGAGAITGFQFTCGTITSGTIKVYGWN